MRLRSAALAVLALLAGCARHATPAPHRVDTPAQLPADASTITVPIAARLSDLQAQVEAQAPRKLWSIDKLEPDCVPAQHVAICPFHKKDGSCGFGIKSLKVLPTLSCRIVGDVTRGPVRLTGAGETLRLTLPVHATISARQIGGIIKQETATGDASVHADVRLSVRPDWTPVAAVKIGYDWTDAPGVTLFGHRITFTDKADGKLAGIIAKLQRDLPQQLRRLGAREKVADAWRQGFTSVELNRDKPPVWLRVTPQSVGFGGYRVEGGDLRLTASVRALTQTFVGPRPPDPVPTPLPPLSTRVDPPALAFQMPVLADYGELEPVLERALTKLAARGITVPKLGPVDATFGKVTVYATDGGRLAVGVKVGAKLRSGLLGAANGEVWLTGVPWNAPNSERIEIRDLQVTGDTDRSAVNLLLLLFQAPSLRETLRTALTQNFAKDYDKVLASARRAIAEKRQGDFVLAADIGAVDHGRVIPTGQGLYLPLQARGTATIAYRPK